jgi:hypothetical protein
MYGARGYHPVAKGVVQITAGSLQSDIISLKNLSDNQQTYVREGSFTSPVETVEVQEETRVAEGPNQPSAPYNPSWIIPLCLRDPFLARAQLVYARIGRDDEEMLTNLRSIYEKRRGLMRLWLSWWSLRAIRPAKVSTGLSSQAYE